VLRALAENAQARYAAIGINVEANVRNVCGCVQVRLEFAARIGFERRARQNILPIELIDGNVVRGAAGIERAALREIAFEVRCFHDDAADISSRA
jgi:hypothetical protein